jgi:DNA-directed RNA polymerase subunit RPC12/RpoP
MKISELSEDAKLICRKCGKEKTIDNFYLYSSGTIDTRCKECQKKIIKLLNTKQQHR